MGYREITDRHAGGGTLFNPGTALCAIWALETRDLRQYGTLSDSENELKRDRNGI
jgi:hypothetical protein